VYTTLKEVSTGTTTTVASLTTTTVVVPTVAVRGHFNSTCSSCIITDAAFGGVLQCSCRNQHGVDVTSNLVLNDCVANINGNLIIQVDGAYAYTCGSSTLTDSTLCSSYCENAFGDYIPNVCLSLGKCQYTAFDTPQLAGDRVTKWY